MTQTGHELADVGRTLSWSALASFVGHEAPDSALAKEIAPKTAIWATRAKTNAILADIFDMLAMINANLVAGVSGKRPKIPKRYERPAASKDTRNVGGSSAMPRDEMVAWIEQKRAEHKNKPMEVRSKCQA